MKIILFSIRLMCFTALGVLLAVGGIRVSEQPGLFSAILGSAIIIGVCSFLEGMYFEREWRK